MIRALLFIAISLPAAAQQTQAPPAEPRREPERRPLNLRLDNPSSFATIAPDKDKDKEKDKKDLPGLGDDARKIAPAPLEPGTRSQGGPYPADTNPTK